MIRLFFILLYLLFFLIVSLPLQLILFILRKVGVKWADTIAKFFVQLSFRIVLFLGGTKITVNGLENIPADKAVLFIGNHNSYFDIVVSYIFMKKPTGYISKKDLLYVPSLNTWMMLIHCLFLDRKDVKAGMKMMLDAVANIKNGISMVIFPEGTRNKTGDETNLNQFKAGSFKIAEKAKCPIVPMALTGTANIFERQFPLIKGANVTISFGKPIETASLERNELKLLPGQVQGEVLSLIQTQQKLLP